MKKIFLFFLTLVVAFAVVFYYFTRPLPFASPQVVVIKRGATLTSVTQTLYDKGIIRSPFFFKLYLKLFYPHLLVQAGSFKITPTSSLASIVTTLQKGRLDKWLTFPEGWRNEEIADLLAKELHIDKNQFLSLAQPYLGRLFPDTYLFPLDSQPQTIIDIMLANYRRKTQPFQSAFQSSSLSEQQILTLASLVERETLTDQEKPIVAGILLKRLNHNWPLQTDASIQYILGKPGHWWPIPSKNDLQIPSPYNTYLHTGLPPTPIANPGLSSIKAVLFPAQSPYWFYLHDKQGRIHYASTFSQHQANIHKYLLTD